MKNFAKNKRKKRQLRHHRVRAKVFGTKESPRLSIYRSLYHLEAQLINDKNGRTILGMNSQKAISQEKKLSRVEVSKMFGTVFAKKAKELGISQAVFDRGGCKYHGRIKAFAEGAREAGLKF